MLVLFLNYRFFVGDLLDFQIRAYFVRRFVCVFYGLENRCKISKF